MTKIRISVPTERFEMTATLLEKEAPRTCRGILAALPVEGKLIHGMMSGNETFIVVDKKKKLKLGQENQVYTMLPGDIAYFYSMWGDAKYLKDNEEFTEIAFMYGRYVRTRDITLRETAANLFGHFTDIEGFTKVSRKARYEGPMKLRIERE